MTREMMSTKEVAEYLNINEKQVYKLIQEKKLPATRITGKWTFPRRLIDAWIIQSAEGSVIAQAAPAPANHIVIMGSHDFTIELLSHELTRVYPHFSLSLSTVGSTGGLIALAKGICQAACAHLFDPETQTYNVAFLPAYLSHRAVIVVGLVFRDFGLIVPRGNPLKICSVADMARGDVKIVNRQEGSGTRMFFDGELKRLGINSADVRGYGDEVATHNEAALAVFSGSSDAAMGIFTAAHMLGLDFVHLAKERFDLIIPRESIAQAPIDALLQVIRSEDFKAKVNRMGGYDTSVTGQLITATA
jgi:putative molybdopterin biosynthesis protein